MHGAVILCFRLPVFYTPCLGGQLLVAKPIAPWRFVNLTLGVALSSTMALHTMMAEAGQPHAAVLCANTAVAFSKTERVAVAHQTASTDDLLQQLTSPRLSSKQ